MLRLHDPDEGENPKDRIGITKPPLSLVPSALVIYVSKVQENGRDKYGLYNWRDTRVRLSIYLDAALRHIWRVIDGEDIDTDSGLPHLAHAAACMGIVLDAQSIGKLVDDRGTKGAASELIGRLTDHGGKDARQDSREGLAPGASGHGETRREV